MRTVSSVLSTALLTTGLLLAGCGGQDAGQSATEPAASTAPAPRTAVASLAPTEGYETTGQVTFTEVDGGVRVEARVENLTPGPHGFHIHETGDCSAPDATSAGGHYNPQNTPHGAPDTTASARHMGDLGNIEANQEGVAVYDRTDPVLDLDMILGKAVIVHGGQDDLHSQPSGAAGPRVACGVIELQEAM
ncbi:hypothetical protein AWN76_015745 [Rhodothermaceae bacterium RA]|nr:hypothetical protein AWN76_015745 [Rhodothermaceae bacterium RA]